MKFSCQTKPFRKRAFTLIELLIVIAIIAILAGVVIAVINPAQQRLKAQQGVARANVAKLCLARGACLAASSNDTGCDTYAQIGANAPISSGAVYAESPFSGTVGSCVITCATNNVPTLSGTCVIQQ